MYFNFFKIHVRIVLYFINFKCLENWIKFFGRLLEILFLFITTWQYTNKITLCTFLINLIIACFRQSNLSILWLLCTPQGILAVHICCRMRRLPRLSSVLSDLEWSLDCQSPPKKSIENLLQKTLNSFSLK